MSNSLNLQFARMLAARESVIAVRAARTETLMRYRDYLRAAFSEFASNVDPITGSRFAEVSADGNKARGDLAISLTFFEGTKLSIGIDPYGRYVLEGNPARVLGDIATIVNFEVNESSVRITYDTSTQPTRRRTIDGAQLVALATETAVARIEADVVADGANAADLPPTNVLSIGALTARIA